MFEKFFDLPKWAQILIIVLIALVIVVVIVFFIWLIKSHHKKESYTTAMTSKLEDTTDPLFGYVNGWINNVRNMYQTKSVVEGYSGPTRTNKNFNGYKYLDYNGIKTGNIKY